MSSDSSFLGIARELLKEPLSEETAKMLYDTNESLYAENQRLRGALGAANALIGESADEKKALDDRLRTVERERDNGLRAALALTHILGPGDSVTPWAWDSIIEEAESASRGLAQTIDERDRNEDRIDEIADALGDDTEWSSANDRGVNAVELAEQLTENLSAAIHRATVAETELAELTEALARLVGRKGKAE